MESGPLRRAEPHLSWLPSMVGGARPLYRAIVDALEEDIRTGRVSAGTRLPPQRRLAEALRVDFTTVSRAYNLASQRGLVEGRVGQGTFVRAPEPAPAAPSPPPRAIAADPRMNVPPLPEGTAWREAMRRDIGALAAEMDMELLLRYQLAGGGEADRLAGVEWLRGRLSVSPDRLLVAAGAQAALLALVTTLCEPGDLICCEALTYPGFRSLAANQRLRLVGLPMDADGLLPEAFEEACRTLRPKALYCIPTLHNPTTATLPLPRRQALAAIARQHGVPIIEDDAYGALAPDAPPPLAALAPDIVFHISGLAKCVSPALRIAYLVVPEPRQASRLMGALRATVGMTSPLTATLATRWIGNGTATLVRDAIRAETAARQRIARRLLPPAWVATSPDAFHLWLRLPQEWGRGELLARFRPDSLGIVASDAFAVTAPPEAIRIALGSPGDRQAMEAELRQMAELLAQAPDMPALFV